MKVTAGLQRLAPSGLRRANKTCIYPRLPLTLPWYPFIKENIMSVFLKYSKAKTS